jgi:hypothetical protein
MEFTTYGFLAKPDSPPSPLLTPYAVPSHPRMDEVKRLQAVRCYDVLDTPPGASDRITALAARLFKVPIAIVSIVDTDRIWFKSHGLDATETERDSGCAHPRYCSTARTLLRMLPMMHAPYSTGLLPMSWVRVFMRPSRLRQQTVSTWVRCV